MNENEFDSRPTPQMNIYGLRNHIYECTKVGNSREKCFNCPYHGSTECKSRLLNAAAHAITLLLEEREGKPLIVTGK